jgi:hypothetical protein
MQNAERHSATSHFGLRWRHLLSANHHLVVGPGFSQLAREVPREQPFLKRVENRLLKDSQARSTHNPNHKHTADQGETAQFSSAFNPAPKDRFHTLLLRDSAYAVSGSVKIDANFFAAPTLP